MRHIDTIDDIQFFYCPDSHTVRIIDSDMESHWIPMKYFTNWPNDVVKQAYFSFADRLYNIQHYKEGWAIKVYELVDAFDNRKAPELPPLV